MGRLRIAIGTLSVLLRAPWTLLYPLAVLAFTVGLLCGVVGAVGWTFVRLLSGELSTGGNVLLSTAVVLGTVAYFVLVPIVLVFLLSAFSYEVSSVYERGFAVPGSGLVVAARRVRLVIAAAVLTGTRMGESHLPALGRLAELVDRPAGGPTFVAAFVFAVIAGATDTSSLAAAFDEFRAGLEARLERTTVEPIRVDAVVGAIGTVTMILAGGLLALEWFDLGSVSVGPLGTVGLAIVTVAAGILAMFVVAMIGYVVLTTAIYRAAMGDETPLVSDPSRLLRS
ncbi:hypothetical protein [Halopiger goleimassiliensis]|uniref:hypothetical protein n=1 Tax=Halopiger goleimassiliensis TaxID=1293048 RepID=UPI000677EB2F|nr:hypothetical protein [Halopiger goleimassiliensis]